VDAGLLTSGLSTTDRGRLETAVARAEALVQAHRDDEAVDAFRELRPRVSSVAPDLDLRTLTGQAWSHLTLGQIDEAVALLNEARSIAEGEAFTDVERADVLFRLGVARYHLSSISTATALLGEALALAERSGLPCD